MAKTSMIERNKKRPPSRQEVQDAADAAEGDCRRPGRCRPRSGSPRGSSWRSCRATPRRARIRNRCDLTGRPRGYYRKLRMSRIALRDLGSQGLIPGMIKSSW